MLASHWIENVSKIEVDGLHASLREAIIDAIESLSPDLRDIVEAIIYERLTFREAADRLGYSAHSQVYYKYQEALEIIGAQLEGEFG